MDNAVTTIDFTAVESKLVIQPHQAQAVMQPLDLKAIPKIRTKLRLWTIIIALNVSAINSVTEYYI